MDQTWLHRFARSKSLNLLVSLRPLVSKCVTKCTILPTKQINWNKYLTSLLDDPLSDDEEIIVNVPTFFAKVDKLLLEVDSK